MNLSPQKDTEPQDLRPKRDVAKAALRPESLLPTPPY